MNYLFSAALIVGSIQSAMQQPIFPGKLSIWLLFVLSIVSWVMIVSKLLQLSRMKKADRLFSDRLRKSRTTLEVFEEGWRNENSLQLIIYHAGARETAFQLLGSRNPTVGIARDIRDAGQLTNKQYGFLESAFRAGFRTAATKLNSGVGGLKLIGVAAILVGLIGCTWTLMAGFDAAGEDSVSGTVIGSALGFLTIALFVATPALIGRLAFAMVLEKRRLEIRKFRDDITRLFEREFAMLEEIDEEEEHEFRQEARVKPARNPHREESASMDDDVDPDPPTGGGKKRYHSIRDRLLSLPEEGDQDNELSMNPIARQAATAGTRS